MSFAIRSAARITVRSALSTNIGLQAFQNGKALVIQTNRGTGTPQIEVGEKSRVKLTLPESHDSPRAPQWEATIKDSKGTDASNELNLETYLVPGNAPGAPATRAFAVSLPAGCCEDSPFTMIFKKANTPPSSLQIVVDPAH